MHALLRALTAVLLLSLGTFSAPQARAELIAANHKTDTVYLHPLRNGLSALTLVWPLGQVTEDRALALQAGLRSVLFGGTASRSPQDVVEYIRVKGIRQSVSTTRRHLLLTITAPKEVFPETLVHLENLLMEPTYTSGWYQRERETVRYAHATLSRNPDDVRAELQGYLSHQAGEADPAELGPTFRFGRPSQAILRSGDPVVEQRLAKLLSKLSQPAIGVRITLPKWLESRLDRKRFPFELPTGTIHFQDPTSSEMLIILARAEVFEDEPQMVGANLLMNHIGASANSDMFRILRQEMRASYDPRSYFDIVDKNRAVLLLSATVKADNWPRIYDEIGEIYQSTHSGNVPTSILTLLHQDAQKLFIERFFHNPIWSVNQLLREFPNGVKGNVVLPIIDAIDDASPRDIIANADSHLPPLDDYLLILIGGGPAPTAELRSNGYCTLPPNTPLKHCLTQLATVAN